MNILVCYPKRSDIQKNSKCLVLSMVFFSLSARLNISLQLENNAIHIQLKLLDILHFLRAHELWRS